MPSYGRGYTGTEKVYSEKEKEYIYSDLSFIFRPSPTYTESGLSGDVVRRYDNSSIDQSVRNILLTNPFEKAFAPGFGCNLRQFLFESDNGWAIYDLIEEIKRQIGIHEPRIVVNDVIVNPNPDNNELNVQLNYDIKVLDGDDPNSSGNIEVVVERTR